MSTLSHRLLPKTSSSLRKTAGVTASVFHLRLGPVLSKCCTSLCGFKQAHVVIWLLLIEGKKSRSVSNEYSEKYIHFK